MQLISVRRRLQELKLMVWKLKVSSTQIIIVLIENLAKDLKRMIAKLEEVLKEKYSRINFIKTKVTVPNKNEKKSSNMKR